VQLAVVDGDAVPVVLIAGPLRDSEGRPDGAVLVVRDVRREREVEDLKTSILANISHELRTPLTPIKGYAGVLRDREVDRERTRQFATEIVAGVDQLERVIGQLVTFGAIAAGRLDLAPQPVDPSAVIEAAVVRWRDRVTAPHRLVVDVGAHLPTVLADQAYLDRALDELIDNALKYSPDGGDVALRVGVDGPADAPRDDASRRADRGDDGNGEARPAGAESPVGPVSSSRVVFTVSDDGVGIEPGQLGQLTDEFAQLDGSATRRFGGLGLGLAFADRIVRAHGGQLMCTSLPGRGTTFSMLWPVDAPDAGGGLPAPQPEARR
jgi:signal transduction histidine kinase